MDLVGPRAISGRTGYYLECRPVQRSSACFLLAYAWQGTEAGQEGDWRRARDSRTSPCVWGVLAGDIDCLHVCAAEACLHLVHSTQRHSASSIITLRTQVNPKQSGLVTTQVRGRHIVGRSLRNHCVQQTLLVIRSCMSIAV